MFDSVIQSLVLLIMFLLLAVLFLSVIVLSVVAYEDIQAIKARRSDRKYRDKALQAPVDQAHAITRKYVDEGASGAS